MKIDEKTAIRQFVFRSAYFANFLTHKPPDFFDSR